MTQKEQIINLLKEFGSLTQGQLAERIYGSTAYSPNIYASLSKLVETGLVIRTGSHPSFYSLINSKISIEPKPIKTKATIVPIEITNEVIEEVHKQVVQSNNYGKEDALITACLKQFPNNTDVNVVAMKIGLIDVTNSTNISRYKSYISVVELAEIIAAIPDIDERIKNGDPDVVNIIAKANGKRNLFSFASKYCCYHNKNLYNNDDYSIFDSVLKQVLPRYFNDITKSQIELWQKTQNYKPYNDYITRKLNELNITIPFRKRKFDHFIWYSNRGKK